MPKFTGDYTKWPAYSELFTALIINRKDFTDIAKLQYLLSSLAGEPAQKVETLPLKGASFSLAWNMLREAYANKCHLIQAQLDKLYASRPANLKVPAALKQLITLVEGVMTSLISLGVTTNLGDAIMTHLVARQMDKGSREAWETSLTSANDYPTFPQIREFVNNRVRALERAEAPSSQGPTSSSAKASSKPSVQRASFSS